MWNLEISIESWIFNKLKSWYVDEILKSQWKDMYEENYYQNND